ARSPAPSASAGSRRPRVTSCTCRPTSTCASGATPTPPRRTAAPSPPTSGTWRAKSPTASIRRCTTRTTSTSSGPASMEGRSAESIAAANKLTAQLTPDALRQMPMLELFAPTPLFALARFGKWQEVLASPAPSDEFQVVSGMWHYTRGLALAATGKLDAAASEQARVAKLAEAVPADRIIGDNQPPKRHLELAAAELAGDIAARGGRTDEAVKQLEEAVRLEDQLPYTEPPAWWRPTRQVLGAVLLEAGRPVEAEAVYREVLRRSPDNGWSLLGLAQSLRGRDPAAASSAEARFGTAWTRADVHPKSSRF